MMRRKLKEDFSLNKEAISLAHLCNAYAICLYNTHAIFLKEFSRE
jgi:hypothetical protein